MNTKIANLNVHQPTGNFQKSKQNNRYDIAT